jgi:hypothetical protein
MYRAPIFFSVTGASPIEGPVPVGTRSGCSGLCALWAKSLPFLLPLNCQLSTVSFFLLCDLRAPASVLSVLSLCLLFKL